LPGIEFSAKFVERGRVSPAFLKIHDSDERLRVGRLLVLSGFVLAPKLHFQPGRPAALLELVPRRWQHLDPLGVSKEFRPNPLKQSFDAADLGLAFDNRDDVKSHTGDPCQD
jgi:hypothetical protein